MSEGSRRRLAAIMFADMVGYTALMQEDEDGARTRRDRFMGALKTAVDRHHGEILQHYGDGALSVFDSAVEAVEAAVALQREVRTAPEVPLRIGVHAGDIVYGPDGVFGDGVNVASRIESLASPGGVLISGKVFDEIKNHTSISSELMGEVRLKNVKRPQRVFAITNEGLAVPTPKDVMAKAWGGGVPAARGPTEPAGMGERLLEAVRERALVPWMLLYLICAWAVLQATSYASAVLAWPPGPVRMLTFAVAPGLPIVLVVTWFHGQKGRQQVTRWEVALIAAIIAVGGGLFGLSSPPDGPSRRVTPAGAATTGQPQPSLAVLPFENTSGSPEAEPFAAGIHDDLLTQLSKIRGLQVISRTSVLGYRGTEHNIPQIGRELGVTSILEGGVQRVGDRIRINAQLIDAETDLHLWAETYDTVYTVENVFAIQSAIAMSITDELEAVLTRAELEGMHQVPTADQAAYEMYLSGIEHLTRPGWGVTDLTLAQQGFEGAVAADPDFALAFAHLSIVHFLFFRVSYDQSEQRLQWTRQAAERSLELDPDLPQGHQALSQYFYVSQQYDRALAELTLAGKGLPNDPWVAAGFAMVRQRQGAWEQAAADVERAVRLDPRNPEFSFLLGDTYAKMRRYDEAERQMDRTLALAPGLAHAQFSRAHILLLRDGDLQPMLSMIGSIPPDVDLGGQPAFFLWWARFLDRDFDGAEVALAGLERAPRGWPMPYSTPLLQGMSRWFAGRPQEARPLLEADLPELEDAVRRRPDQAGPREALGLAYAMLGRTEEAIREGVRATELLPISRDAYDGPLVLADLARIYAITGDVDRAIDQLEVLLSVPGEQSAPLLRIDPTWDALRGEPRFQALVGG